MIMIKLMLHIKQSGVCSSYRLWNACSGIWTVGMLQAGNIPVVKSMIKNEGKKPIAKEPG